MFKFKKNKNEFQLNDFVELGEMESSRIYLKMRDNDILRLLKARYTNCVLALTLATLVDKKRDIELLTGRIFELLNLINSIEQSEEALFEPEKYLEKEKKNRSVLQTFKDKLLFLKKGRKKLNLPQNL